VNTKKPRVLRDAHPWFLSFSLLQTGEDPWAGFLKKKPNTVKKAFPESRDRLYLFITGTIPY